MARDDSVAGGDQLRIAREIATVEGPVGMIAQLLVALIEAIDRAKEGDRIGDMDRDRDPEIAAYVPHGIEARVIDGDQLPCRDVFAEIESERLENLQSARPIAVRFFDGLGLNL